MAAEVSTYQEGSLELNRLAQQTAWVVISKKLFHGTEKRDSGKLQDILNGRSYIIHIGHACDLISFAVFT